MANKKIVDFLFSLHIPFLQLPGNHRSGQKAKDKEENTSGTAGGPGGRDQMLGVKIRKIAR